MNQMMQMFGQMMAMPMTAFAEAMARTMQGMQPGPMTGMHAAAALPAAACSTSTVATRTCCCGTGERCPVHEGGGWKRDGGVCCCGTAQRCPVHGSGGGWRQDGGGCYTNVRHTSSDRVILYEWTLVDVGRSTGQALSSGQKVVDECTSTEQIHNEVICEFLQKHQKYEGTCKNLRVYCRQLDSWCKESWDFEATQIEVLEGIQRALDSHRKGEQKAH